MIYKISLLFAFFAISAFFMPSSVDAETVRAKAAPLACTANVFFADASNAPLSGTPEFSGNIEAGKKSTKLQQSVTYSDASKKIKQFTATATDFVWASDNKKALDKRYIEIGWNQNGQEHSLSNTYTIPTISSGKNINNIQFIVDLTGQQSSVFENQASFGDGTMTTITTMATCD